MKSLLEIKEIKAHERTNERDKESQNVKREEINQQEQQRAGRGDRTNRPEEKDELLNQIREIGNVHPELYVRVTYRNRGVVG